MSTPTTRPARLSVKEQPLWTVPAVLALLMLSSGGFFVLLATGIQILSGIRY
jgi:hypothetical protein